MTRQALGGLKELGDATGQIRIRVTLRDPYLWSVRAQLASQSGEMLATLARSAETFQAMLEHAV